MSRTSRRTRLEAQRGWIAASVELRLTDEEEKTVRDYLKTVITAGNHLVRALLPAPRAERRTEDHPAAGVDLR